MSGSTIGSLSRNALLFLGGVALGYSIKKLIDDESFEEVKYAIYDLTHKNNYNTSEYIDVEVKSKERI